MRRSWAIESRSLTIASGCCSITGGDCGGRGGVSNLFLTGVLSDFDWTCHGAGCPTRNRKVESSRFSAGLNRVIVRKVEFLSAIVKVMRSYQDGRKKWILFRLRPSLTKR